MYRLFFKRFLDFTLSLIAIILLSPIYLIVAILVRVKLGSPVIFKQKRPGKDEKIFKMYKSTSLDELPELFNISKGDMSIIGPRPLLVHYLPLYNGFQKQRHDVRPGLTGLAQVSGRNAISWEEKFEKDVEYTKEYSFLLDMKILFMTVKTVFKKEGISSDTSSTMEEFKG